MKLEAIDDVYNRRKKSLVFHEKKHSRGSRQFLFRLFFKCIDGIYLGDFVLAS